MNTKTTDNMSFEGVCHLFLLMAVAFFLASCQSMVSTSISTSPASETAGSFLADYQFPGSFHPANHYLFYLHGRIIEDQGIPAISPDYGEYQYEAILQELESRGFEVISEQRPKDTDSAKYARKVAEQIRTLRAAGVPSENIAVVGASKGAGIAAIVSSLLEDSKINFVLLGFCSPDTVRELLQNRMSLYGNFLAIRDSADGLSGSCQELFEASKGQGLVRHNEILLNIGTGHGILYQPLDEWIQPTAEWAKDCGCNE